MTAHAEEGRKQLVHVRVTEEEKESYRVAAERAEMTLAEWLRLAAEEKAARR